MKEAVDAARVAASIEHHLKAADSAIQTSAVVPITAAKKITSEADANNSAAAIRAPDELVAIWLSGRATMAAAQPILNMARHAIAVIMTGVRTEEAAEGCPVAA